MECLQQSRSIITFHEFHPMNSVRVQGHHALFPAPAASALLSVVDAVVDAGLVVARFALAIAPHAPVIRMLSDPYNAAQHLHAMGRCVEMGASVGFPILAIDAPRGLCRTTGVAAANCIRADYTLALGTLSAGLFTADGRAMCGEIWFNDLGLSPSEEPCAFLNAPPALPARPHNTHKGSFGDVAIIGGAAGMSGAALLAGTAALHGGAGRVFIGLLGLLGLSEAAHAALLSLQPELMVRQPHELHELIVHHAITIVAGCGGGAGIAAHLPSILQNAHKLVLDADALNALANNPLLQAALHNRPAGTTVLTPHPLEAARLMNISVAEVQSNRLNSAQMLANRFACVVILKGSGSIIAAPNTLPRINPTGNARLAAAGTGDVLAGLLGAYLAAGMDAQGAACAAVFRHGEVADHWNESCSSTLTARELALRL
ncbi:MAG: hypothetical protein RIR79_1816 [Pseudomonadota bacterium]|jgi:hydroxyethylthiazole kinase-like uncharacterized protein yjeF